MWTGVRTSCGQESGPHVEQPVLWMQEIGFLANGISPRPCEAFYSG